MAAERHDIGQVDGELRRVGEAADGLVRAAQELRGALDALSESVRVAVREAASAPPPSTAPAAPAEPPIEQTVTGSAPQAAEPEPAGLEDTDGDGIPDGARLVALDMVLDGKPREEVAAHLREEFGLADSGPLLDDVYARVGG